MDSIDQDVIAMSLAHENGDLATVRRLIESRPELESAAPDETWLHRAAGSGQIAIVDYWLERGCDVNLNLYEGNKKDGVSTPLHHAKDAATCRHLLSCGARVNDWCRYGGTPLHCAVVRAVEVSQRGRRRTTPETTGDQIRALLEAGADPTIADFEGLTPLALAAKLRRTTAEQVLRAAGAPEKGNRPAKVPTKAPRIDLRTDAKRIASTLKKAVARMAKSPPDQPLTGLTLVVSGIEGFVMYSFDINGAENPWDASHSEFERIEFPTWRDAYDLGPEGRRITGIDGTERVGLVGDAEFDRPFFEACVAVLRKADVENQFGSLPRSGAFTLGVEAMSGTHESNWPDANLI